jgi:hypothetical protein
MALVRERTILTERPPLVGKVSADRRTRQLYPIKYVKSEVSISVLSNVLMYSGTIK